MVAPNVIVQYVIYENPSDFPGKFVLRRWDVVFYDTEARTYPMPKDVVCVTDTIEEARERIPLHLYKLPSFEGDDPVIKEVWM